MTDELNEEVFAIPRIDELTSSSDESDFEGEFLPNCQRIRVVDSMASAIQKEFLRKIPKAGTKSTTFRSTNLSTLTKTKPPSYLMGSSNDNAHTCVGDETEHTYESIDVGVYSTTENDLVSSPAQTELPKNALVLLYGCIKMRADELRDLNLERCLNSLLRETDTKFALLRIQELAFTLENCDANAEAGNETLPSYKSKKKKAKSRRNSCDEKAHILTRNSLTPHERKPRKMTNFLSCMSCANASEYQLLQHNDSICLKAYEGIRKRKRILEFPYKRIIFCGAEIKGMPGNILTWVHHVVKGNYGAVECYAIECDDVSHARLLAKALGQQILSSTGA